jgi:hypothetical protein
LKGITRWISRRFVWMLEIDYKTIQRLVSEIGDGHPNDVDDISLGLEDVEEE